MSAAALPAVACKLNVILDIDETFVYFIKKAFFAHSWDTLSPEEKAKYIVHDHKHGVFIERPHLDTFLDYLFANCTVSVWTWSDREYAEGIVTRFLLRGHSDRKIEHIFAEEDAEASSKEHGNSKDLNYLWYKKRLPCFAECNTILIDDLPGNSVNTSNIKNSITVKPFALFGEVKARTDPYEDVSDDTTLLEVIEILKKAQTVAAGCYTNDDKRWSNIFSAANVKAAGLEGSMVEIKKKSGVIVKAIGAGLKKNEGGARRRKTRRRRAITRRKRA
jgi:hypothetical protein